MGLLLSLLALIAVNEGRVQDIAVTLNGPAGQPQALMLIKGDPLEPPKLSPRRFPPTNERWEFDWLVSAYGVVEEGKNDLRFRIFSQERKEPRVDQAQFAGRMAMRMWSLLREGLDADHVEMAKGLRMIDVYLAWGGEPGSEQEFTEDTEGGHRRRANAIYVYDLGSFREPVEMARELAHEYGHAVLPAIGGFETPEDWGNGYLGERLFLKWLRDGQKAGHLVKEDMMNATLPQLDAWVARNVDALVLRSAAVAPDPRLIGGKGQASLDAFLGLALYMEAVMPPEVFARTLRLIGSMKAADYPAAAVRAAEEKTFDFRVPPSLQGKAIWLPVGKGRLTGGKVLSRSGDWAKVQPNGAKLTLSS